MKSNILYVPFAAAILSLLSGGASAQQNLHSFHGEAAGDRFGWAVCSAGDTDGDGIDDWLFGSPFSDQNGTNSGSVRLVSGADGTSRFTLHGVAPMDLFGYSLACAGDVDGDGFSDLVIGAYGNDDFGPEAGTAYVFSGQSGALLHELSGGEAYENSGISVAGAGDVDGDGLDDLFIGANHAASGATPIPGSDAGKTYLFFGSTVATGGSFYLSVADASFLPSDKRPRVLVHRQAVVDLYSLPLPVLVEPVHIYCKHVYTKQQYKDIHIHLNI